MKRNLSFLPEIHQAFRRGASDSTVRACVALLVFAPFDNPLHAVPAKDSTRSPETAIQTGENQAGLPESATVRLQEQPYLRNAFKEPIPASRSGLDDFFARTRGDSSTCCRRLRWIL